mmetsp:Transcript_13360/g.25217  ORF Transcript_13360/g.25217 Transcript_13360/m.25217 type:complete len:580 (+) Transcript_13360:110-1849(+)
MGAVCCVNSGNNTSQPKPVLFDPFDLQEQEVSTHDQAKISEVSKPSTPRLKNDQVTPRTRARFQGDDEVELDFPADGNNVTKRDDRLPGHDIDKLAAAEVKDTNADADVDRSLKLTPRLDAKRLSDAHVPRATIQMDVEGVPVFNHPLMVAWKLGRIVQAARELKRLEEAMPEEVQCFPASVIEQVRRIGRKFEESQSLLSIKINELPIHESNPKLKLDWGLQVSQGLVRAVYCVDRDLDVCKGIAALQEKDLDVGLKENIVQVDKIGLHKPNDAIWRVQTHTKAIGTRGDDIVVESMADALDEPIGSIWLSAYSPPKPDPKDTVESASTPLSAAYTNSGPSKSSMVAFADPPPIDTAISKGSAGQDPDGSCSMDQMSTVKTSETSWSRAMKKKPSIKRIVRKTKKFLSRKWTSKNGSPFGEVFNGFHLPPPDRGASRSSHIFVVTKVTPLHPAGTARLQGFRQMSVVEAKIPPAVLSVINVMPNFMVKKLARNYLENAVKVQAQKISLPEIEQRLKESERAPFYKQLRCHLLGEPPATLDWSEDVNVFASPRDFQSNMRDREHAPGKSVAWAPRDDDA